MASWRHAITHIATDVEGYFDRLKQRLDSRLGREPITIVPYRSYGTAERVVLRGRVLEDQGRLAADDNDSVWENLLEMYQRFATDEIAGARVRIDFAGVEQEALTSDEGHFRMELTPNRAFDPTAVWHTAQVELLAPKRPEGATTAQMEVLVPPPGAQFGIISDIDDTVMQTGATSLLRMARTVFLGNARTRLPFPGVAALYQALYMGAPGQFINPIFYVSSSPWNIYDMLTDFFQLQGIPQGPMFLRDWGLSRESETGSRHHAHKLAAINEIMTAFPDLPFLLIGDSGQEDPEIYTDVVRLYPDRVQAIYIRSVDLSAARIAAVGRLAEEVAAAGSTLVLAEDTVAAARHAADKGWITAESLSAVVGGKEADVVAPAGEEYVSAPAPVVLDTADVATGAVEETLEQQNETSEPAQPVVIEGEQAGENQR